MTALTLEELEHNRYLLRAELLHSATLQKALDEIYLAARAHLTNTNGERDGDGDVASTAVDRAANRGTDFHNQTVVAAPIETAREYMTRLEDELAKTRFHLPEPIAAWLWRNAEDQVLELAKVLQTIAEEPVNWNATDHHYYAGIVGRFQLLADGVLKASPSIAAGEEEHDKPYILPGKNPQRYRATPIAAGEEDVVVPFTGITKLDLPAERIIGGAAKANLDAVVIIGFDGDGDFFFSANKADGGEVLWLMELARKKLMEIGDQ
jgi:hypothetical protein